MVNNPILYAAIMTLWHVALPGFPIFFKCLWNCEYYVTCYNITCLFTYFGFIESHYNSSVCLVKLKLQNSELTVSVCILEGTNTRASEIRCYFPQLPKYEDFCSISSMLKGIVLYFWNSLRCIKIWIL